MKINEILQLANKYPIPLVDRSLIKKIGDPGQTQVITLKDGKDTLRVVLKCENHFLDPDKYTGKYVKIMSGKPVNNKPVGITFSVIDDKKKVIVTEKATVSIITEKEGDAPAKSPEPQLTETVDVDDYSAPEGPHDDFIVERINTRAHIAAVYDRIKSEDPTRFTFVHDEQGFITSLYMDCISSGKTKLLPIVGVARKKRFEKEEKPAKENPVQKSNKILNSIEEAVRDSKLGALKKAKTKNGVVVYDLLMNPIERAKAFRWYWMNREDDVGELTPMKEALASFYSTLTFGLKREFILESIKMDLSMLCKIPFDGDDALNECLAVIMKKMKSKEIGSTFVIEYFALPKADRTIDYPIS